MTWVAVAVGGGVGTLLRDFLQRRFNPPTGDGLPRATLGINLAGAFLLGLTVGWTRDGVVSPDVALLLGAGFCGAFTTWSGFMWEWLRLAEHRNARQGWSYVIGSLGVGIALAGIGLAIG